ncbi:VanZ family protein [Janibacter terrae]|uniref:VanZ family protein n=1 Tax=Janibacter terrae TaxID=103817 RepID=A0ABZ2FB61_9MICO|nr:VanZ family protein [Janibacter terrae]
MPVPQTRRRLLRVAFALVVLLQLVVLYAPQVPGPPSPVPHGDKVVHAFVFGLPVLVAGLARRRRWPAAALLCAVHAPVSEVMQHAVLAHRSGDPWDVLADLVGVGLAAIAVPLVIRRPRRRRS